MSPRDFKLAKISVGGLLICTAALAIAGVLSLFAVEFESSAPILKGVCIVAFAGMAGFSLAVAQAAASCAQLLDGEENASIRGIAYLCAIITGMVSVAGVYLGDGILRGHAVQLPPVEAMLVGGFALAFIKPAMTAVITACETRERGEVAAADIVLRAKDERIAQLERELRNRPTPVENASPANVEAVSQPRPSRASQSAGRAVARVLRDTKPNVRERASATNVRAIRERAPPLSEADIRELVDSMFSKGEVINLSSVRRAASAKLGAEVPYSRVERSPGRHLIEARAAA